MRFRQFDITIQDLQVFLAVAECASFSGAAKLVGKSQPSVSSRIIMLEERLQKQLFLREAKSVRLSDDGKRLRSDALTLVDQMAELHDKYHEKGERQKSVVRVCSPIVLSSTFVRASAAQFQERNPEIELKFSEDAPEVCVQRVIDGKSDVAMVPFEPFPLSVNFEPLFTDVCKAISASDHPLTRNKSAKLSEILKYPILSPDAHSALRREMEVEAEKRNIKISFVSAAFGITNYMSLISMASSNLGVAITSANFIPETFSAGIGVTEIEDCTLTRTFGVLTANDKRLSVPAKLFCDYLANIGAQLEGARLENTTR